MSGTPDCSSDMTDDICGRLDHDDLASRVCELVSRPAWTEEQMRPYARRQAREVGESSGSPLGRASTVSSLDSSVEDDSPSVCNISLYSESQDRSLRGRTDMVMNDYAKYISYVDKSRSSLEELVGDASILRRIQRASTSSSGQDLMSEWRHEPIEPIRGRRRSSDVESCAGFFEDVEMNEDKFSVDLEGARFAARDVLARVDGARQSGHERSGVFLVLFGVVLGVLMSVSFGESMRRWETSARQQNESLPGSTSLGRTRTQPWSIAKLLSSAMPSIRDETREKYDPRWYEFHGTYSDSFSFCSRHESRIPCPYSVYCPGGRGAASALQYEGDRPYDTNDRAHVPIVDLPFGWARLGVGLGEDGIISEDTCSVRIETKFEASEVSSHLLCCRDAPLSGESDVKSNLLHGDIELRNYGESDNKRDDRDDLLMQRLEPVWFDSRHGWSGKFGGASRLVLPLVIF